MLFFIVEHKPGSLYKALKEFYKRKINLTMIYSRPLKEIAWNYYFYVEIEGSLKEKRVKKALKELIKNTVDMKIKGSFIKI
ncbi:ACT domain-containing protein [Caldisphaera sp.]